MSPAMRRLLAALAAAVPVIALIACGGRTDGIPGGGGCPAPASVTQGASCSPSGQSCPSTGATCDGTQATCTCLNGAFECGDVPVTCTTVCPVTIVPSSACDPVSQGSCTVSVITTTCTGGTYTASCSCETRGGPHDGQWDCGAAPEPDCPDAQPPGCPPPSTIQPGGTCSAGLDVSCQSAIPIYGCSGAVDGYETCYCDGGSWSCAEPGPPECADVSPPPPKCPDPSAVQQGNACFEEGEQCPGRPTFCGGQVLYDAFQCTAGAWDDIATTICDVDDASVDGGSFDGGAADAGGG